MKFIKSIIKLNLHKEFFKYRLYFPLFMIVNDKIHDILCSKLDITFVNQFMTYTNSVTYIVRTKGTIKTNGKIKKKNDFVYYINFNENIEPLLLVNNKEKKVKIKSLESCNGPYLFFDGIGKSVDNGYYLWLYYQENHPEIASYYVVKEKKNLECESLFLENVLEFDSPLFRKKYKESSKIFSSVVDYKIENYKGYRFKKNVNIKEFIFLTHGPFLGSINLFYRYRINYFIASDNFSFKNIINSTNLHETFICNSGLPRTDYRYKESNRNIVYAPTWDRHQLDLIDFTFFFNENLIDFLEEENLYIKFIPHHLLKYKDICHNERIKVVHNADYNKEIANAKLFITDYSSVFMDFWWQNVPIYFIQRNKLHYDYTFNYSKVGVVVDNVEKLIQCIKKGELKKIENSKFEIINDHKNCQRIFEFINKKEINEL